MPANHRISEKLDEVLDDLELVRDLVVKVQKKLRRLQDEFRKNSDNPKRK